MNDYLLLIDPKRCPGCGFLGRYRRNGLCGNCGLQLFPSLNYDFPRFAAEVVCNFWAFDKDRGWVNRDHLLIHGAKPITRELNLPKLPKGYGTKTTPEQIARRGGKITKAQRKQSTV
jgi:hypothetical protein